MKVAKHSLEGITVASLAERLSPRDLQTVLLALLISLPPFEQTTSQKPQEDDDLIIRAILLWIQQLLKARGEGSLMFSQLNALLATFPELQLQRGSSRFFLSFSSILFSSSLTYSEPRSRYPNPGLSRNWDREP